MRRSTVQSSAPPGFWALVERQHGVVARGQLLELGFRPKAIDRRLANGRLHAVRRGVYAVGRSQLTQHGHWMAAVLSCGPGALLSHMSAAAASGIREQGEGPIEITVPAGAHPRQPGIVAHRRGVLRPEHVIRRDGIPMTSPIRTLVDIADRLGRDEIEAAVNEADRLGLTDPQSLRSALDGLVGQPGAGRLREVLDRRTFTLTDSKLERRFLPLVRAAGLPAPLTQRRLNGFKVDFYWPDLGLVVETDGLRYHRTPAQQSKDRRRDQAHTAAGLTPLRFTHAQVRFEPAAVQATLAAVGKRLHAANRPRLDSSPPR